MPATYEDRIRGLTTAVAYKAPCRVATTGNVTLSGLQTIDGVTLTEGDRVLVKNQSNPVDNGIWKASALAWERALDFNGARDVTPGTQVMVLSGTANGATIFKLVTESPVIGASALTFTTMGPYYDGALLVVSEDITVNIPSDFLTMQDAVDHFSGYIIRQGVRITLNIETGHQITAGLLVAYGDYSHFYIASEDPTVEVADGFVGVHGPDGPGTITAGSVIMAYSAIGPILGTILDGRGIARTGYYLLRNAQGGSDRPTHSTEEEPGGAPTAGAVNMLHSGIKAQEGSVGYWENSLATNCGTGGVYAERNSIIHAEFADASNCIRGFIAVRGSTIAAGGSKADGCHNGYWALRAATISAEDSTADGCKAQGYRAEQGSTINAHNTSAKNCDGTSVDERAGLNPSQYVGSGYFAYRGSRINAASSDASGCVAYGYAAHEALGIKAPDSTANGCQSAVFFLYSEGGVFNSLIADDSGGDAVSLNYNSSATLRAADIDDALGHGVIVRNGSSVDLAEASIVNSGRGVTSSISGVYLDNGSRGNCDSATVTGSTGKDLRVNGGSTLNATGCTTTNGTAHASDLNITANTLVQQGVIFVN